MSVVELDRPALSAVSADRAAGAIVGALIGDALGVGPHWYYDITEQRRDYGDWIKGYTTPRDDRYHAGLKPGEPSQTGIITRLLLRSLVEQQGYDEADFQARFDTELFDRIDGTPNAGPGGFTHKSVRAAHVRRKGEGRDWGDLGGNADTSEAAERILPLAVLYAADPARAARLSLDNIRLLQTDPNTVALSVTFAGVIAALVGGAALDGRIGDKVTPLSRPAAGLPADTFALGASPLTAPGYYARLAANQDVRIEPAASVANVFGLSCAIYFVLPAAYYLAARFAGDFESAVLHALNGGGQNLARTYLTGALVGAQVGLSGIPQRFIDGLADRDEILHLAREIGRLAAVQPQRPLT